MPSPKSPFPGFDPYVQRFWRDVHSALIVYTREKLSPGLPGDLRARIEERLIVEEPFRHGEWNDIVPDLYLAEREGSDLRRRFESGDEGGMAVMEPLTFRDLSEPLRETYLEIREPGTNGRVITVIEYLSPTNKTPGDGMDQYLEKQAAYRDAEVSLVEVDLIRGGRHVIGLPEARVPDWARGWPRVCIRPGWGREFRLYPIPFHSRMPVIAVPLRKDDAPLALDLQSVFDRCYDVGEYGLDIDYREESKPPLALEDAKWIDAMLREKGLRK